MSEQLEVGFLRVPVIRTVADARSMFGDWKTASMNSGCARPALVLKGLLGHSVGLHRENAI